MNTMTLGSKLKQLRTKSSLSLGDIEARSGVARQIVWRVEKGKTFCRKETLDRVGLQGLQLHAKSPEWKELQVLWTAEVSGGSVTPQEAVGSMELSNAASSKIAAAFLAHVAKLPPPDFAELAKAVARPSVLKAIAALNAIAEAKSK